MATRRKATKVVGARAEDVTVPVDSLAGVVFAYSPDSSRLRVRFPLGGNGVLVDLSRSAALDLVDKVGARAAGMAEPVVPAQAQRVLPTMLDETEVRR